MLKFSGRFSRALSVSAVNSAIQHVTVIGGGLMGSGIAQIAADTNHSVVVVDQTDDLTAKTLSRVSKSLGRIARKKHPDDKAQQELFVGKVTKNISLSTNVKDAVKSTDLVIEAIPEILEIKRKLFQDIDSVAPYHTIFTSNTSSLPITEIAKAVERQDRFGGLHFFNPVPIMKLVEIIRINSTSDETFNALIDFTKAVGKASVKCKDTPGFIVNRLLVPYLNEAIKMAERNDATKEDIDVAMKLGAGYPMGPFELCDYVGLDTMKLVLDSWSKEYPDEPSFITAKMITELVDQEKLGVKTGEGFYSYKK